jgi:hypothetical protein
MVNPEAQPNAQLEMLPSPWEFWMLRNGESLELRVIRFEHGLVERFIRQGGRVVYRPALRLYVPPEDKPGRPPYWDVTAQGLIQRLLVLYEDAIEFGFLLPISDAVTWWQAVSPARAEPLPLVITRADHGSEIQYAVKVYGT